MIGSIFVTFLLFLYPCHCSNNSLPLFLSTWPGASFESAAQNGWTTLLTQNDRIGAVISACETCQTLQCDGTVGYGGSPDENGETTLDAMIMDGVGHRVGAVGDLRDVKNAVRVAYAVMQYTKHTFLVGESATRFAEHMGFNRTSLTTQRSKQMWLSWKNSSCQTNFWKGQLSPDPQHNCGPYKPSNMIKKSGRGHVNMRKIDAWHHDTIGVGAIDLQSNVASATSTNGATFKIHGRVGDSPIVGAGSYADNQVGFAAGTGDGDVMMRFLPAYQTVESMRRGMTPMNAASDAIKRIARVYPKFSGAIIAGDKSGRFGAACHGLKYFQYQVGSPKFGQHIVTQSVKCVDL